MPKGWVPLGEAKSTGFPSPLNGGLELQNISITTADQPGYVIFRNSISTELADEAATAIHFGLTPLCSHAKYFEYPVPPIGMTVYKEFMKVRLLPRPPFSGLSSYLQRKGKERSKNSSRRPLYLKSPYPSTSASFD